MLYIHAFLFFTHLGYALLKKIKIKYIYILDYLTQNFYMNNDRVPWGGSFRANAYVYKSSRRNKQLREVSSSSVYSVSNRSN
jgi:hypothetical protein